MKGIAVVLFASVLLGGCATGTVWKVTGSRDPFTDQTTEMVTTGDFQSSSLIYTSSLNFYPIVRKEGGEIYVGLMSGGSFKVPVGTVQMRIDQNEAWTITPQETPLSMAPAAPQANIGLTAEQAEAMKNIQSQYMDNFNKLMSPYTLAGGDKAKAILRQMVSGNTLIYRTVGINQAGSTTGEARLDESLRQSLQAIGIDPGTL